MTVAADLYTPPADPSTLVILGRDNSFNVRKILWLCEELGLPFIREDYGRGFKPTNTEAFRRLNPTGQIPVVIADGFLLRESNAILRYVAAKHGAETLYPTDLERRALIEQWMDWIAYDVTHALRGAFLGGQLREAPWNNDWFIEQGRKDLIDCVGLVEAHLAAGGPYMLGADFTLADIPMGLVINRWFMLRDLQRPETPAVSAYYERLSERSGFRKYGRNGLP